jgi:hypothetical protein
MIHRRIHENQVDDHAGFGVRAEPPVLAVALPIIAFDAFLAIAIEADGASGTAARGTYFGVRRSPYTESLRCLPNGRGSGIRVTVIMPARTMVAST